MDFLQAASGIARRGLCNQLATRERTNALLSSLRLTVSGVSISPASVTQAGDNLIAGLLNCPASGGPYPELANPGFTGGQCTDEVYRVTTNISTDNPNAPQGPRQDDVIGPVFGLEVINGTPSSSIAILHGADSNGDPFRRILASGGFMDTGSAITDVVSLDPDPQDCGDPNPGGSGSPIPGVPLDYNDPEGNPVSTNVNVTVNAPVLLPNGTISFPVNVQNDNFDIDFNFNSGGGPPTPTYPGGNLSSGECCPDALPLFNPPEGGEDPPEDDPNGPIIGVVIITTAIALSATPTQKTIGDGPDLVIPRLGTVQFGVKVGRARAWLNVVDIKNKRCFIPVPDGLTAVEAIVNPVKGVTLESTIIYQAPTIVEI